MLKKKSIVPRVRNNCFENEIAIASPYLLRSGARRGTDMETVEDASKKKRLNVLIGHFIISV